MTRNPRTPACVAAGLIATLMSAGTATAQQPVARPPAAQLPTLQVPTTQLPTTQLPPTDASAAADLRVLQQETRTAFRQLLGGNADPDQVRFTYLGKGAVAEGPFPEPADPGRTTDTREALAGFTAFNPNTRNQFRIEMPGELLSRLGDAARQRGLDRAGSARGRVPPVRDPAAVERVPSAGTPRAALGKPGTDDGALVMQASWSTNVDNRSRLSSLNAATTSWPWRTIGDLQGCTATLIGPRHAITAAHCIYNRANSAWAGGFTLTPGRAGANWAYGQAIAPSPNFTWYFTPEQWRQANPSGGASQYDIGILIIPARLGDQAGWMGWFYGTDNYIGGRTIYNRGYPVCNGTDSNGNARTDDPGDPGSSVVCTPSHLYGDSNTCSVGGFTATDGAGWTRRFAHSCDASAAQSGSPLYFYLSGDPRVTAVHTTSTCGMIATSPDCTAQSTRPLAATKITREYSDWIAFFRAWQP